MIDRKTPPDKSLSYFIRTQYTKKTPEISEVLKKSDRRGSNPRSRPWQGRALPTTPLSHKRVMGIEPTYPAWKAGVLPLNYTRRYLIVKSDRRGSNPRSRPWQGRALPTTPLSHKRVMGIEPTYPAWKAGVLPLNYTRTACCLYVSVSSTKTSIYDEASFVNTKFKFFIFF